MRVNNKFFLIQNILSVRDVEEVVLVLKKFNRVCDFFQYPYISSDFGIVQCDHLSQDLVRVFLSEVQDKMVLLPYSYKDAFVLFPLNLVRGH